MTAISIISLAGLFLLVLVVGIGIGIELEIRYGAAQRRSDRYFQIIMRMIPKLRETYTAEYIYWDLVRGDHDHEVTDDTQPIPSVRD